MNISPATIFNAISAIAASASAVCWIKAARVRVIWLQTLNGPPPQTVNEANRQSWWNSRAAWYASAAAGAQVIASLVQAALP
jgi:hypothetical protein